MLSIVSLIIFYQKKWRPPGRRNRGRPKLTWAEGIRGLMGEKGLMEEDWNDRNNWRKKIIYWSNCLMGAGRCGNIVQRAKYINNFFIPR
jgi:hypothetical protein